MTLDQELLIIYNNDSRGTYSIKHIKDLFEKNKIGYDLVQANGIGTAKRLANKAPDNSIIVSVSGDGGLNEVLNGIIGPNKILAGIPNGTGNDFLNNLGIKTPEDFITALKKGYKKKIDIGLVKFHSAGKLTERYFLNSCGIGFNAEVVKNVNRRLKSVNAPIAYILSYLKTLYSYNPIAKLPLIEIVNSPVMARYFELTPKAKINDGYLDVISLNSVPAKVLFLTISACLNSRVFNLKIKSEQRNYLKIELGEILVHVDGDIVGETPAEIKLIKEEIDVIYLDDRNFFKNNKFYK